MRLVTTAQLDDPMGCAPILLSLRDGEDLGGDIARVKASWNTRRYVDVFRHAWNVRAQSSARHTT